VTDKEAYELGKKFSKAVGMDWSLFSKTFGFFQWKRKQKPPLTDASVEALGRGYRGEPFAIVQS
jgi:hypothetical protein